MLHRTPIVALVLLGAAGHATADYSPPDGTGWWQLLDGQYTEVCSDGGGVCDPAAGTYTLIDFGTSPATRTTVTVGSDAGSPASSALTYETATEYRETTLTAACPTGRPVGGSCSAEVYDAGYLPVGTRLSAEGLTCTTGGPGSVAPDVLSVTVACLD